jgi:hypothetical protein
MPLVDRRGLPFQVFQHLLRRLHDRKITLEDLVKFDVWLRSDPIAPDGPWYKDFGNFKVCGEGRYPKTFLMRDQVPYGKEID